MLKGNIIDDNIKDNCEWGLDDMTYREKIQALQEKRKRYLVQYEEDIDQLTRAKVNALVKDMVKERKDKGVSQKEIAELTGMQTPNVARFESCKGIPTLPVLMKYASALGKELELEVREKK